MMKWLLWTSQCHSCLSQLIWTDEHCSTCLRLVHMPGLIGNKTLQACCDSLDCSRESAGHTRSHCITDIISDVKTIQSSLMQCDPVTAQSWKLQTFRLLPEFLNLHTYQYHWVSTISWTNIILLWKVFEKKINSTAMILCVEFHQHISFSHVIEALVTGVLCVEFHQHIGFSLSPFLYVPTWVNWRIGFYLDRTIDNFNSCEPFVNCKILYSSLCACLHRMENLLQHWSGEVTTLAAVLQ